MRAIRQAVGTASGHAGAGLAVAVTGSAAVNADSGVSSTVQNALLLTALLIVAVVLLIVYRSPMLWLLPLFGAIGAIELALDALGANVTFGTGVAAAARELANRVPVGAER